MLKSPPPLTIRTRWSRPLIWLPAAIVGGLVVLTAWRSPLRGPVAAATVAACALLLVRVMTLTATIDDGGIKGRNITRSFDVPWSDVESVSVEKLLPHLTVRSGGSLHGLSVQRLSTQSTVNLLASVSPTKAEARRIIETLDACAVLHGFRSDVSMDAFRP